MTDIKSATNQLMSYIKDISSQFARYCVSQSTYYQPKSSTIQAYTLVYNFSTCKPSYASRMLELYRKAHEEHLQEYADFTKQGNTVQQFNKIWRSYICLSRCLSKRIFVYLDRYYLSANSQSSLQQISLSIFHQLVLTPKFLQLLQTSFKYNLIQRRSDRILCDRQLLYFMNSLSIIDPQLFVQFKTIFLKDSQQFYHHKFQQYCTLPPIAYYNSVNNLSYFQRVLMKLCLPHDGMMIVVLYKMFENKLIETYTDTFINHQNGLLYYLDQHEDFTFTRLIVQLYSQFQGFDKLRKRYYEYVCEKGNALLAKLMVEGDPQSIVTGFCQFYNDHTRIITVGFNKQTEMYVSLGNAIETVLSSTDKLPTILFKYARKTLDTGIFPQKQTTIELLFDKIALKDQFIHLYEQSMEDLILQQNFQVDRQQTFIDFITKACGNQHTRKLQEKLADYVESSTTIETRKSNRYLILQLGLWDKRFEEQLALIINLPPSLNLQWTNFESTYLQSNQRNSKKKLHLLPFQSKLLLRAKLNTNIIDLKCNLLQASILMHIAQKPSSIEDISICLNIQRSLLVGFLQSVGVVTHQDDIYAIDWDYKAVDSVMNIDDKVQLAKKYSKTISQDRQLLIEARIVRFLKRQKESTFQAIMQQLPHSIHLFKPQPTMVRQTIIKLAQRSFLQVLPDGRILYKD